MHIDYQCSGGFGGLRLAYKGETDALPAAEAKLLLDLIEAANVFKLNPKQVSQKTRNIPDDFTCRLTLSMASFVGPFAKACHSKAGWLTSSPRLFYG
jgi:hypothetical protein